MEHTYCCCKIQLWTIFSIRIVFYFCTRSNFFSQNLLFHQVLSFGSNLQNSFWHFTICQKWQYFQIYFSEKNLTFISLYAIQFDANKLLKMVFLCALFGYLYFLSFHIWTRMGYINQPGLALTPFPSSVGWDEIWTHNLLIMNLVCYPPDQTFAL